MSDTPFADKVLGVGRDRLEEREGAHWELKAKRKASVCLENPKKNQQRGDGIFLINQLLGNTSIIFQNTPLSY